MRNLLSDVEGLTVGHAGDAGVKSGVSVIVADRPAIAAVHVMGGAPGTRETDLLDPSNTVQTVDALFLSGGSAFGLDAGAGVMAGLKAMGRGFAVGPVHVPIVPGAIVFDLLNGGDKNWGDEPPYRTWGREALDAARADFELGTAGAGIGALTAGLKGGLGSASMRLANGATVAALAVVNALGSATIGKTKHFRAAPFEIGTEFGGLGLPTVWRDDPLAFPLKGRPDPGANTTIAVIATDLALTKAEARRLAMAAHDGFARALWPSHTPLDGDLVFALSTARTILPVDPALMIELSAAACAVMARAIARGVHSATPAPGDLMPSWSGMGMAEGKMAPQGG